jgi:hypothetical protein
MFGILYWETINGVKPEYLIPKILADTSGFIIRYEAIEIADIVAEEMVKKFPTLATRVISLDGIADLPEDIKCGDCGAVMNPKDEECEHCGYPVDVKEQKKFVKVFSKVKKPAVRKQPFPEQEYNHFLGTKESGTYSFADGFVGCWKLETALQVAKTLREDGFKVKVRGRGSRHHDGHFYVDHLPLKYATHGSVYVEPYIMQLGKWIVPSFTKLNVQYDVTLDEKGKWECTCEDWRYRGWRRPDGDCKHIEYIKKYGGIAPLLSKVTA